MVSCGSDKHDHLHPTYRHRFGCDYHCNGDESISCQVLGQRSSLQWDAHHLHHHPYLPVFNHNRFTVRLLDCVQELAEQLPNGSCSKVEIRDGEACGSNHFFTSKSKKVELNANLLCKLLVRLLVVYFHIGEFGYGDLCNRKRKRTPRRDGLYV
jgi:hypothetical protein